MNVHLMSSFAAALAFALPACAGADRADIPRESAAKGPPLPPPPEVVSSRPNAGPGEKLYLAKCAMCHGANGMAAVLLARRMDQPLLEKRTDLTRAFVVQAARTGIGNMPAIPRGEVGDAEMAQIAVYLSRNYRDTAQ